jgi:hypothetical protein
MMTRTIIVCAVLTLLIASLLLMVDSAVRADDFSLRLAVNGEDIPEEGTVAIDSEGEFKIDLRISDVTSDVILRKYSITVTLVGVSFPPISENLGDYHMVPGDSYQREMSINAREVLNLGDRPLTTGIYRSQVKLEYSVSGGEEVWSQWINIRILGNPLSSVFGIAGAVVSAVTIGAVLWLVKGLSTLYKFAMGRLESLARGRVVGSIVNASKKFVIKEKCPICGKPLKNEYCYTCMKSAKQVRLEYRNRLKNLAIQGEELLAGGEVTRDELCTKLNIEGQIAADVIAIMNNARLFRVKGVARGLMIKAILAGICFTISTVIWVTVGGFAVLSTAALLTILIVAIVIPLIVTWGFRIKAKRAFKRSEIATENQEKVNRDVV